MKKNTHQLKLRIQDEMGDEPVLIVMNVSDFYLHYLRSKAMGSGPVASIEVRVDGEIERYENVVSFECEVLPA